MTQQVRNDSLNNFETNRDQEIGEAIAKAAFALTKGIAKTEPENIHRIQPEDANQAKNFHRKAKLE